MPCDYIGIGVMASGLALLGFLSLTHSMRFLLPHNVLPHVAALLSETQHLLSRADEIGAIPHAEELRTCLAM